MNYHILSDFHSKTILWALVVVALLALPSVLDSFAQDAQTIILETNKTSYIPGDVVQLSGTVAGQSNVLVALQVKDSSGNLILIRTVQSDQNGNFVLQFKIPSTATSGDFSIVASTKINGFVVTQTKTMTATVPEFGSIATVILLISTISVIIISIKTKLRVVS